MAAVVARKFGEEMVQFLGKKVAVETADQKVYNGILIIGNESRGVSDKVLQFATNRITIPRVGKAESLNAAVATGIILAQLVSPNGP